MFGNSAPKIAVVDTRAGIVQYMDHQQQEMQQSLDGTGIAIQRAADNQLILNMPSTCNLTFASGRADLSLKAQDVLDAVARVLVHYSECTIMVTGHTDDLGRDDANQNLSEVRANSVAGYLVQRGKNPFVFRNKEWEKSRRKWPIIVRVTEP